ncbi:hypothetical protein HY086_05360 [Candidatus Gottesmanbacteria bacterium]|nr:hypothetical protein [Candidatus Gottesmanbacteria bacterium]
MPSRQEIQQRLGIQRITGTDWRAVPPLSGDTVNDQAKLLKMNPSRQKRAADGLENGLVEAARRLLRLG